MIAGVERLSVAEGGPTFSSRGAERTSLDRSGDTQSDRAKGPTSSVGGERASDWTTGLLAVVTALVAPI